MGPQAFARGSYDPDPSKYDPNPMLQWGRRLSPAEVQLTGIMAQLTAIASMGPQAFARGSHKASRGVSRCGLLQWGRRLSPAEVPSDTDKRTTARLLQWGRRLSPAEVIGGSDIPSLFLRFNGAAGFRPRKYGKGRTNNHDLDALQWGRRLSPAEVQAPYVKFSFGRLLQWGRRLSPAEVREQCCQRCLVIMLQWGRRLSPAEVHKHHERTIQHRMLQWGRRLSPAEVLMCPNLSNDFILASMGPQAFARGSLVSQSCPV